MVPIILGNPQICIDIGLKVHGFSLRVSCSGLTSEYMDLLFNGLGFKFWGLVSMVFAQRDPRFGASRVYVRDPLHSLVCV